MGFRFVTQFQHQTDFPLLKLLLQPQSHNPVFLRRLRLLISNYFIYFFYYIIYPESYPRPFFSARRFHAGRLLRKLSDFVHQPRIFINNSLSLLTQTTRKEK